MAARIIDLQAKNYNEQLQTVIARKTDQLKPIEEKVNAIIQRVKKLGDTALCEFTQEFDNFSVPDIETLRLSVDRCKQIAEQCDIKVRDALSFAHERIYNHHLRMKKEDYVYEDPIGVKLGWCYRPLDSVGLYVPGGKAAYPSSVLMNAIPAQIAGVKRIVMVTPTPQGIINPTICAAATILGIEEIWNIGGAQAVAALAYGTQTIQNVDKIVGPGNDFVALAKKNVFGQCGIDMIAGPSEILILADKKTCPDVIAADLLAQAEHDENAQAIAIVQGMELAKKVEKSIEKQLKNLPKENLAHKSWLQWGALIVVEAINDQCISLVNMIAPEHLELQLEDPHKLIPHIKHAGAIFIGRHTAEVFGDYSAGSNHVLPTARTARFCSGLSVDDYMKKIALLECSEKSAKMLRETTITLAKAEGLLAHAAAAAIKRS